MKSKGIRFQSIVLVLAVLVAVSLWSSRVAAGGPERLVAVGDVHGSLEGLTTILEEAGLIDAAGKWVGGSTTFVQVGDLLDRGLFLREVMDLLMRLQDEAERADGEVVCMLGNHEGMNLLGLVRDVNPEVYERFADASSQKRREEAFATLSRCYESRAELFDYGVEGPTIETRDEWMERHPLGKLEYLEALGPQGRYGKWLRTLPTAVRRGDTLFVHAGLSAALQGQGVREINTRVAAELRHFDRYREKLADRNLVLPTAAVGEVMEVAARVLALAPEAEGKRGRRLRALARDLEGAVGVGGWYLVHRDGPIWYRGAAIGDEHETAGQITAILDDLKIERMIIGHTPMRDGRIHSRFGGRVLAIDTGMLSEVYEGGRPSALEIEGDTVTAIYVGERDVLVDGEWQQIVPEPELKTAAAG